MRGGRLASRKTGGRLTSKIRGGDIGGRWTLKTGGRLATKTAGRWEACPTKQQCGRWEVETPATQALKCYALWKF